MKNLFYSDETIEILNFHVYILTKTQKNYVRKKINVIILKEGDLKCSFFILGLLLV